MEIFQFATSKKDHLEEKLIKCGPLFFAGHTNKCKLLNDLYLILGNNISQMLHVWNIYLHLPQK